MKVREELEALAPKMREWQEHLPPLGVQLFMLTTKLLGGNFMQSDIVELV